jgi:membrane protease YdiL (CAAX protease family)
MSDQPEAELRSPGWYADPYGRQPWRWWDGERWTELAGGTEVGWDGAPVAAAEAPAPGLPGLWIASLAWTVGVAATIALTLMLDRDDPTPASIGLPSLALWIPLVLACVVVSRRRGTGSLRRDFGIEIRWVDLVIGIGASVAARLVLARALAPIPGPMHRLRDIDESAFDRAPHGAWTWLVLVLVVCVGAPLVEELFFRGLLQGRLVGKLGTVAGVGVSSVLFGAAHLLGWAGPWTFATAWGIATSGVVLGILRQSTGRLGTSVVAHMAFNIQAVVLTALLT